MPSSWPDWLHFSPSLLHLVQAYRAPSALPDSRITSLQTRSSTVLAKIYVLYLRQAQTPYRSSEPSARWYQSRSACISVACTSGRAQGGAQLGSAPHRCRSGTGGGQWQWTQKRNLQLLRGDLGKKKKMASSDNQWRREYQSKPGWEWKTQGQFHFLPPLVSAIPHRHSVASQRKMWSQKLHHVLYKQC